MRHAIRGLLFGVLVSLTLAAFSGRAEAICFSDNISNGGNPYNMNWHSPDGTRNDTFMNAVYIQLHQTCGWVPRGTLSVTMGWFTTGAVYTGTSTYWNYSTAIWYIHELQQNNWFRFTVNYTRPVLWQGAMDRYDVATSTWVGNGTVDLW